MRRFVIKSDSFYWNQIFYFSVHSIILIVKTQNIKLIYIIIQNRQFDTKILNFTKNVICLIFVYSIFCQNFCQKAVSPFKFKMLSLFFALSVSFTGQCQLCQYVANLGIDLLEEQLDKHDIPEKLVEKCNKHVPKPLNQLCSKVIEMPLDKLVDLLEDSNTVTEACTAIKACKKVSANHHHHQREIAPAQNLASNGSPQFTDETSPQWSISWEEAI